MWEEGALLQQGAPASERGSARKCSGQTLRMPQAERRERMTRSLAEMMQQRQRSQRQHRGGATAQKHGRGRRQQQELRQPSQPHQQALLRPALLLWRVHQA